MDKLKKRVQFWKEKKPSPTPSLSRSQYSLVSCGEVTSEALKLWLELPEEVKKDRFWEPFKQQYEKQKDKSQSTSKTSNKTRLPLVKSAPQIKDNLLAGEDVIFVEQPSERLELSSKHNNGLEKLCADKSQTNKAEDIPFKSQKNKKWSRARHISKMTMLLAGWLVFTVIFMLHGETEDRHRHCSVGAQQEKTYNLNTSKFLHSVFITLKGPFIPEQYERRINISQVETMRHLEVWLERSILYDGELVGIQASSSWKIVLHNKKLDFNNGEPRSSKLHLDGNFTEEIRNKNNTKEYKIKVRSNVDETVPFTMSYKGNPLDTTTGFVYALVLLFFLYVLIIFEVINRMLAAVLISTLSLAVLSVAGSRPTLAEVISWLDAETLLLLFSMMVLVAIVAETGMFDYLAVYTFELTQGRMWPLITVLCVTTATVSTFLDNVTTVLLMAPVTIRLCEVMGLDPVPILISMVLFSNIGGTATPVGDPPNVIIASNKLVMQSGINFTNFTAHMFLGCVLVCVQTYFQLRFMFRDTNKLRISVPREIQELRHQNAIWRRAMESLPHMSSDQNIVRERLERKISKLNLQLESMLKETRKRTCSKEVFHDTLAELKAKYKIRDKVLLIKATLVLAFVVTIFFLHAIPELNRVSLGWTALLGAILLLILYDRDDLEPILHRVEWSTLLFFAALFVLMEALSVLGLISFIGDITERLISQVDEGARLAVAITAIIWVSGVTSAFVDNVPLTTMMVRVVTSLGTNPALKLPMAPLIWALSFGVCLGGNGTVIAASANVVCAGVAEQHGYKFSFMQYLRIGLPIMVGHLIVANIYLLVCHCVFTWH